MCKILMEGCLEFITQEMSDVIITIRTMIRQTIVVICYIVSRRKENDMK